MLEVHSMKCRQQTLLAVEPAHKVYVMYDVPHLLKNICNNLLRYDFTIGGSQDNFI